MCLPTQALCDLKVIARDFDREDHIGSIGSEQSSLGSDRGNHVLCRLNPYVSTETLSL